MVLERFWDYKISPRVFFCHSGASPMRSFAIPGPIIEVLGLVFRFQLSRWSEKLELELLLPSITEMLLPSIISIVASSRIVREFVTRVSSTIVLRLC